MVVKYENMIQNTLSELIRIIHFLDFPINLEAINLAVEYGKFDNMQRMERNGDLSNNERFGSRNNNLNQESYKVRKGRLFGFIDYLSKTDMEYFSEYINQNLSPFYGYTYLGSESLNT